MPAALATGNSGVNDNCKHIGINDVPNHEQNKKCSRGIDQILSLNIDTYGLNLLKDVQQIFCLN